MKFTFHFTATLRELVTWAALVCLGAAVVAEHYSARSFELATRAGVEHMLQQLLGGGSRQ